METKYESIIRELNAGVSMDEVRAKYSPVLHQSVMERRQQKEAKRLKWASAPNASGYLYVFAAGPYVKVGMSDAGVESRWHNIKCANPLLEPPLYVTGPLGNRVREAEKRAHAALSEHRKHGEWFSCDRDIAIAVVKRIELEMRS